jgi:hypothetical protein
MNIHRSPEMQKSSNGIGLRKLSWGILLVCLFAIFFFGASHYLHHLLLHGKLDRSNEAFAFAQAYLRNQLGNEGVEFPRSQSGRKEGCISLGTDQWKAFGVLRKRDVSGKEREQDWLAIVQWQEGKFKVARLKIGEQEMDGF